MRFLGQISVHICPGIDMYIIIYCLFYYRNEYHRIDLFETRFGQFKRPNGIIRFRNPGANYRETVQLPVEIVAVAIAK